ncbi:MAG: calcium-binding protein, partial [Elainella sp.]
ANWNQPQLLTVTGVDDAADDGDVGYSILTSFSSSDSLYAVNEPVDIALINIDNDSATVPPPGNPGPGSPNGPTGGQVIRGTKGNNQLTGTEGDDTLLGLGGNDRLTGSGGDDKLAGGKGRNQLLGGAGADLFELSKTGTAVIQDFQDSLDRLGLPKGLSFKGLDLERRGNSLLIERGDRVLAVLQGVKPAQISSLDFSK